MVRKLWLTLLLGGCLLLAGPLTCYADEIREIEVWNHAVITTSDELKSNVGAKVFDRDPDTYYQPELQPGTAWLRVDFETPQTFNCVKIFQRMAETEETTGLESYQLQISDDGETWTNLYGDQSKGMVDEAYFDTVTTSHLRILNKGKYRFAVINGGEINQALYVRISEIGIFQIEATDDKPPEEPIIYYVSQNNGDDDNDGSESKPFRTIQRAADVMWPGDVCLIREGVYHETVKPKRSGMETKPIVFMAYPGEKVEISGADQLDGKWEKWSGDTYRMKYDGEKPVQLFVDARQMNIARWPNAEVDKMLEIEGFCEAIGGDYEGLEVAAMPGVDFTGATIRMQPGHMWYGFQRMVTYQPDKSNKIMFETPMTQSYDSHVGYDPCEPGVGTRFFLFGALSLLDTKYEWMYEDGYIYLNLGGDSPETHRAEVRSRDYAFDIFDKDYIQIKNLNIYGASIRLTHCNYCLIDGCSNIYADYDAPTELYDYYNWTGRDNSTEEYRLNYQRKTVNIQISGTYNKIQNCLVAYTLKDGITLSGRHNIVYNNVIHDVAGYGDYYGCLTLYGIDNQVLYNTMYNSGRFLIRVMDTRGNISYNDMSNFGKMGLDLGGVYAYRLNGQGYIMSYNYIHNDVTNAKEKGLYLDNYCRQFTLHHNIIQGIYTSIVLNSFSLENKVYHNTCFDNSAFTYTSTHVGYSKWQWMCEFKNNLYTGTADYATGTDKPTVTNNLNVGTIHKGTFMPPDTSKIVDKAEIIKGINDQDYEGSAPDIGALEAGRAMWEVGAGWTAEEKGWR